MSTTLDTTDGRSIDLDDTEAEFIAVPKAEWNRVQDRLDRLENEVDNQSTNVRGAFSKLSSIEDRVDDLESNDSTAEPDSEGKGVGVEPDNNGPPLMEIVELPHELAERECTSNVRRARFIADSVTEYADKAPVGYVLDSKAVKRVLSAADETNGTPHTQTVSRVQDRLSELGGDGVEVRKRHGKRIVVFDEPLAKRLSNTDHNRCDRGSGPTPPSNVIGLS